MRKYGKRAGLIAIFVGVGLSGAFAEGWDHYGGDAGGGRYSAEAQITPATVDALDVAWTYRTGDLGRRPEAIKKSAFEATPILVEDSLVICTPFNEVVALDPGTGEERWRFDPKIKTDYRPANQFVCRGVTYWRDDTEAEGDLCRSRIFMGTNDARLIALDARSGKPCAGFGEMGQVTVDPGKPLIWPGEFQMTSPPVTIGGLVIVGSSIGDNARADAPKGTVRAFDARTGAPRWSFDPVARGAAERVGSWDGKQAARTGHANVWAPMSVDEERDLVFLPTSSPSPDFFGGERVGDNDYANSVVALKGSTGEVVWHFQTVHHDVWDFDLPAQPSLVTIRKDGKDIPVVVQVTKMGLVFVLDRETGKPVFAVEERPVPQGGVAGERLSPTQPFPVAPPPLTPTRTPPDEAWGLVWFDRNWCERKLASYRNEGLYTPPSTQGTVLQPFTGGGANWGGLAYDPSTNLMYVNTSNVMHVVTLIAREDFESSGKARLGDKSPQTGTAWGMKRELFLSPPFNVPCNPPPWGTLHAIDMADGKIRWRSTLGTVRDIAPVPIPLGLGTVNLGGPVVTAGGILFIGAAMDDYLRAFDARTGEELWKGRLPAGGQATPMTYAWKGRQYVVIAAGGHSSATTTGGDHVVAFALPETK